MSRGQERYTVGQIVDLLDENYGIPFNGKTQIFRLNTLSQISMLYKLKSAK